MAKELIGEALKGAFVEKGLAGGAPGAPATYAAVTSLYFESLEAFQNAFGPHQEAFSADVPNFTNAEPVIQIGEMVF